MTDLILSSIITTFGAIIVAVITSITAIISHKKMKKCEKECATLSDKLFVRFLKPGENFQDILSKVDTICLYTVNSFELLNSTNKILEQNKNMFLNNVIILLRKKANETEADATILDNIINQWIRLEKQKRIRHLIIISYDHDSDHYYTLIGDEVVFFGQVLFDDTKPTGTNVNYLPLVFDNNTEIGRQVISNYKDHFKNVVNKYKDTSTIYDSQNSFQFEIVVNK